MLIHPSVNFNQSVSKYRNTQVVSPQRAPSTPSHTKKKLCSPGLFNVLFIVQIFEVKIMSPPVIAVNGMGGRDLDTSGFHSPRIITIVRIPVILLVIVSPDVSTDDFWIDAKMFVICSGMSFNESNVFPCSASTDLRESISFFVLIPGFFFLI